MHHRPDEKRGVGDAAADDDVGALRQSARDVIAADVCIRRNDVLADTVDVVFARVEIWKLDAHGAHLVEVREDVVTRHDRDLQRTETQALGNLDHLARRRGRIGAARVGDDLETLLPRLRQGRLEPRLDVLDVPLVGVF